MIAFLAVAAVVIVTPGQDTALTIRNTLRGGSRAGVLTDALAEEIKADALARMKAGLAAVEALPPPDPEVVFAHAYVDPPPSLRDG